MRVGLNAFFLRHPMTGSGQYLKHLVRAFGEVEANERLLLFSPPLVAENPAFGHCIPTQIANPFSGRSENLEKAWFEQMSLPRASRAAGAEILHYPYFAAPWHSNVPVVVTVHDLIPMLLPAYRGGSMVQAYTRMVATTARKAAMIVADSECSRRDIIRLLGVAEERVAVVYLAASEEYRPANDTAIKQKYQLDNPYLLYLGGFDQRKNLPMLLEAFAEVVKSGDETTTLAIAGGIPAPSALFSDVRGLTTQLGLANRVQFLGRVPDEDCAALYSAAEAFVFPSIYEGFGLPPLEAMACGAAVICSNASSLPEVVGDAAITLPPDDLKAWAEAIKAVLTDPKRRDDLRERGLRQAARFSWQKTAAETLEIYRQVAKRSHH
jgi:glycosyltransferase involved in cell wall biosynthesis